MKTNKQYKSIHLNNQTMYEYIDVTLYRGDLTILHNLCCDVLNQHPEMVGIQRIQEKLDMVLNEKKFRVEIYELDGTPVNF